jgi:hypothetical protein
MLEVAGKLKKERGGWVVAGRHLVAETGKDRVDHAFLADGRHPGTLVQGLLARLFLDTVNARFSAGLRRLEDQELGSYADRVEAEALRRVVRLDAGAASSPATATSVTNATVNP